MKWRNPKKELPKQNEKVFVMIKPHKDYGSLKESAMSIQIFCGETSYSNDDSSCRVENADELGQGNISWYLNGKPDYEENVVIAWIPTTEFHFPDFHYEE